MSKRTYPSSLVRSFGLLIALGLFVTGCAARPGAEVLNSVSTKGLETKEITVFAATTRARQAPDSNVFTDGRSAELNFARFAISIPPAHKASNIEWPKGKPDAQKDFVVTGQAALSADAFAAQIRSSAKHRSIGIFVHGYNYTFQEALFRLAQMAADANIDTVPVLFSWPSQGTVTGYVADREAVIYSRDYLASLLVSLSRDTSGDDIVLFGHSMGSFLIMEAARQLKMEGRNDVVSRLRIILAAPDIDADVFRTQLDVIGTLSPPLTVLVADDDRALAASSLLDGDHPRVGRLDVNDPKIREAAIAHGVQIVDISSLEATDSFRHDRYASLAKLYPQLQSLDNKRNAPTAGRVGAFIFDAAGATISSPFRLASQVVDPQ